MSAATQRDEWIRERLHESLEITHLKLDDESHLHAGHAGARAGGGHYRLLIVSPDFHGLGRVARHRKVYEAMGGGMRADWIHALSVQALTPDEHQGQ